ncbi:oxidoreductase [Caballeronia pedi]|uniref:Oxidoreductase n=1 Tax=Caballeronia pedi TaxID=1777141 RepID=A0A158DRV9_9BURK|nr:2Fe-2S iron-sulfur cluster-binding protein [Caballeronia pedi]SAK97352.1 oxidoreductase [Caballeronia pedi]
MTTHRARIESADREIPVDDSTTLLLAALDAGVAYPHGCRSGRCGSCKTRLIEGQVELLPHTPFSLTASEKEHGLILACRAKLQSDVVVRWLAQPQIAHPVVRQRATITAVAPMTHDIVEIRLRPERAFSFSPGQFGHVMFPGLPSRSYSFAHASVDGEIAFHVRTVPNGRVSPAIARTARPGWTVEIDGPYGEAYLREDHAGPILAVAGGSGLAPILCIVERAVQAAMHQPIHVYFGARDVIDVYGMDHLGRLSARHPRLRVHAVLSSARDGDVYRRGMVHQAIADDLPVAMKAWKAYVAGPPAMVDAVGELCGNQGMRPKNFHADPFFTPVEEARV